ncbi:hypothetical protein EAH81_11835 [Flavobacterium pectinovorum]|uniref:Uncharacterized protein n=1 Tax=Flavobacterium pectinovorum TaxID=29533 RepID=A0A502ES96_9FLAO|nr:hypothetical protein EAH81_11835 [Flavobacterium pectinovorum]
MTRIYIMGHWILTLLSGPLILILKKYLLDFDTRNTIEFLEIYPIMIIMGFMFSIPTYLFCILIFNSIEDKNIKINYAKISFILIIIIGIWITTFIISGTLWFDIAVSYSISAITIGFFFKSDFKLPSQT